MLGLMKSKQSWNWTASGKHPVAKDYFWVGSIDPLLEALSKWVKNGYQLLNAKQNPRPQFYCWRFWVKGPEKNNLVCGVGRDSSDSLGRSYPLLIMGTGPLKAWEKNWDLLPFALENTWTQIEYLAARRFMDLQQLEDGIRKISAPVGEWQEFEIQGKHSGDKEALSPTSLKALENLKETTNGLLNQTEWLIGLDSRSLDEQSDMLIMWHLLLREHTKQAPNAIFMGGIPEKTCLALFQRPLRSEDFVKLWSVCAEAQ